MPCKTGPQRAGPDTPALGNSDSLSGPKDRLLHPPPERYSGHLDQPALASGPETGGRHYTAGSRSKFWSPARVNNDEPDSPLYPPAYPQNPGLQVSARIPGIGNGPRLHPVMELPVTSLVPSWGIIALPPGLECPRTLPASGGRDTHGPANSRLSIRPPIDHRALSVTIPRCCHQGFPLPSFRRI